MDLKKIAKTFFDNNKELKEITGTRDGHFFYSSNLAIRHCVTNKIEGDDKYTTFSREDFQPVAKAIKKAVSPKKTEDK